MDTSLATGASCQHLGAQVNWVPAVVAAHALKASGSDRSSGLLCGVCCSPLTAAEQAAGCCSQGHCVGLSIATGLVHCLACKVSLVPEALTQSQQAVRAAWQLLRTGTTPGAPGNDPAPQVLAKRRRLSRRLQELREKQGQQQQVGLSSNGHAAPHAGQGHGHSDAPYGVLPVPSTGFSEVVVKDGLPLGLRGLNNLGNTCFMNSVLQALVHTPLVRLYYLGDGHAPGSCRWQSSRPCLSCEMDSLFSHMYSGMRQPFSPVDFLYSWWCQNDKLAEYQQQDAHEFYLSALSALSQASPLIQVQAVVDAKPAAAPAAGPQATGSQQEVSFGNPAASRASVPDRQSDLPAAAGHDVSSVAGVVAGTAPASGPVEISSTTSDHSQEAAARPEEVCMVEAVFGGLLRSDVRCSVCGHTSSAYDPFLDLSLDLLAVSKGGLTPTPTDLQGPALPARRANRPGATPTPEASVVSGAEGPQGRGFASAGAAGALQRAGDSQGPAGASESCSLGDNNTQRGSQAQGPENNGHTGLTQRLSESSLQDGDLSHRLTPEISDVSSLLVVPPELASGAAAASKLQKPPAVPKQRRGGQAATVQRMHTRGARGQQQPQASLECADSPVQGAAGAVQGDAPAAQGPLPWESPLEDSMSSPLHGPKAGGTHPVNGQQLQGGATLDRTPGSRSQGVNAALMASPSPQAPTSAQVLDDVLLALQMDGESSAAVAEGGEEAGEALTSKTPGRHAGGGQAEAGRVGSTTKKKAAKARPGKAAAERCGECHTCLHRHLRRACLRAGAGGAAQCGGAAADGSAGRVAPSPPPGRQVTPEPSELAEGSMIQEPACSHLAMQTVAWPVGQGQQGLAASDSRQETGEVDGRMAAGRRSQLGTAAAGAPGDRAQGGAVPLSACLDHFIQEEALHTSEAWVCSHCRRRQQAVKQMSVRRLPPVLCFHVKRFEHAPGSARVVRKLQTRLAFPTDHLDMTPYMTSTLLQQRCRSLAERDPVQPTNHPAAIHMEGPGGWDSNLPPPISIPPHSDGAQGAPQPTLDQHPRSNSSSHPDHMYSLFSVICHKGDITGGHYVAYVRCCGTWFCCDDAWVTMVSEAEVCESQAYMLFYTQTKFDQYVLKLPTAK